MSLDIDPLRRGSFRGVFVIDPLVDVVASLYQVFFNRTISVELSSMN